MLQNKFVLQLVFVIFSSSIFAQYRQANTVGSELYADAPYRIKKYNDAGNLNGIPVHFYIHDSECLGCNNELLNIQIKIKNAADHSFGSGLTFNSYSDSAFNALLSCRSPYDSYLDKMDFNASGFQKDASSTIKFTADHSLLYTYYVDITHRNWYFTLTIPEDKLIGFNDIIDIEVNFSLNLEVDQQKYLRVYRYNEDIPKVHGWYRGDTHYHSFYTQNQAENGLPMEATKLAAKYVGLDWITISDHSCDFDNYGGSMADNWQYFGNEVAAMNSQDSSFMFIRGVEMSIKNSEGKVIHALTYPSPDSPFGLPYLGDGGGDLVTTNVSVVGLLDSLNNYGGFCYSAHPFAEKDGLPFLINGGLWNIGDTAFPTNGENFPSGGIVGCNNLAEGSDFYSLIQNEVFKESLTGGQIWNLRNSLSTSDEPDNPWNALYSSATPFALIDPNSTDHFMNRFNENLDVMDLFWKRSLGIKNQYPSTTNWKFFMSAGSDAHGSFNYSNTDQTMGVYGSVNDNAIGRLSTIAYCPDGMGHNGSNILKSLKNGQTVLSDGPIITIGISTDGNDQSMEINIGEDTIMTDANIAAAKLIVNVQTTAEYGTVSNVFLTGFLGDSIYYYNLPVATGIQSFNLKQTLENLFGQIPNNEYFLIKATLVTLKDYGTLSALYNKTLENFHSFTNPIWIKQTSTFDIVEKVGKFNYSVYPNPVSEKLHFDFGSRSVKNGIVKLIDIAGKTVASKTGKIDFIDVSGLADGLYIVNIIADETSVTKKFVVSHSK